MERDNAGMNGKGLVLALAASMLWGGNAVVMEKALARGPLAAASLIAAPLAAAAIHDGLASVWVGGVNAALGRWRSLPAALRSRNGLVMLGAALCGGPLAMGSFVAAIGMVGPSYAVTLTASYPAVGAILSRLILKERVRLRGWLGISLAVAGAALASYAPPAGDGAHQGLGTLLACLAALGWGAEGVLAGKAVRQVQPSVALNLYEIMSFLTFIAVVLPLIGSAGLAVDAVTSTAFPLLVVASLCGAGGYLGFYRCLDLIGPARSMTIFSTYILWTLLFASIAGQTWPDWRLLLGGVVVLAGITLLSFDPAQQTRNRQGAPSLG